ncbi:hypothetical protein [uncultured Brachyspira sp.]|uniref:hypothetical protein n=1 Tax=uncultured Brachyspira sp. TaxID=221953 RepID=UPI0032098089
MKLLKNKILIKPIKKLIFIISILMIVALNLLGEEKIEFYHYYYTNKLYHSTLKTEIIPSEYVFITTNSTNGNEYSYLYNLKTKEKKLFYIDKGYSDYKGDNDYEYYDINGNLTTNWTDENMRANGFYEITNNRFGETFYNQKIEYGDRRIGYNEGDSIGITKGNGYIQKAYKYSLTQPEIINKKDRGIYLFKRQYLSDYSKFFYTLCFQNEYYADGHFSESRLLNYTNGRVIVHEYRQPIRYIIWYKSYNLYEDGGQDGVTNTIYFQLNNKSLIKPTWTEFTNDNLNYIKNKFDNLNVEISYTKGNIEDNLRSYSFITNTNNTKYLGFIPIEEFEYYLLAD